MADVEIEVTGNITPLQSVKTSKSMFQVPMQISLSSPAAREWFGQQRENIRPWTVFVNTGNFRTPSSLLRVNKRIMKNVEYFQSNYFFVFLGLIIYCLITSPLLLIAVAASLGACYILSLKNTERKINILGHELTLAQQYGLVALCSLPLFYLAGAGSVIFWVLGASIFIITLHAAFYNIDAVLNPDEERVELMMEQAQKMKERNKRTLYFIAHVLGACSYGEILRNSRHHYIRSMMAQILKDREYTVYEEVSGLVSDDSTRRIDIIAFKPNSKSGIILDLTVRFESHSGQPEEVDLEETIDYYKLKYQLDNLTVSGLMTGAQGTILKFLANFWISLGLEKTVLLNLSIGVIKQSVSILRNHLYGHIA